MNSSTKNPLQDDALTEATKPADSVAALLQLRDGNRRFASDLRSVASLATAAQRAALASAQSPFAIILSCADSRVPSEMVFDQGLGSLFVVRVAGNIVAPSLVGSIEYAVLTFGVQLVVVMGHTSCGAVLATLQHLERPANGGSKNILDIVERIRPAVAPLVNDAADKNTLISLATRANVRASAEQLRRAPGLLTQRVQQGELLVVGAEYSLETGIVDMFDGVPEVVRDLDARAGT